jgi:hypothetical protein
VIRVADVNGDGHPDFSVSLGQAFAERPPIYLDDGTGTYQSVMIRSSQPSLVFADANGDGHTDIVSALAGDPERIGVQLQLVVPNSLVGMRAVAVRAGIRVSWPPTAGADRYELWRSTQGKPRRLMGTTFQPRFDDHTARRHVRYAYAARAVKQRATVPSAVR